MLSLESFKAKAFELFGAEEAKMTSSDPISFLYAQEWNIPNGSAFPEDEMARMNVRLDDRGCFGRAVKAAVLVEKYFPGEQLMYGEVLEDLLRAMLLQDITPANWHDDTYIAEILQYENPHAIIVCGSKQFDPLFLSLDATPARCRHPRIAEHDIWNGLYATYLTSYANIVDSEKGSVESISILRIAEKMCPSLILTQELIASRLGMLQLFHESIPILEEVAKKRTDAKILFILWMLTEKPYYRDQIVTLYDKQMLNFLTKMYVV